RRQHQAGDRGNGRSVLHETLLLCQNDTARLLLAVVRLTALDRQGGEFLAHGAARALGYPLAGASTSTSRRPTQHAASQGPHRGTPTATTSRMRSLSGPTMLPPSAVTLPLSEK